MLECRTCAWRCLRAFATDASAARAILQRPLILTPHLLNPSLGRRRLATSSSEAPAAKDALSPLLPLEKPTRDVIKGNKGGKIVIHNEKALRKELDFLHDRFKLAEHVNYTLRNNNPERALDICRLASRNMNCVVAWNHVLAWHMKNNRVTKAVDIFNEMKKRGQFPDGYTYTRLLKGFAGKKEYATKAVSIYYGMNTPTSKVKPNITHTNIILRVCALAQDMDALWGVISQIPDTGPNAPDSITYTTILQAIRHCAMGDQENPAKMAERRQDAVNEGRRIWQEIIAKWRAGSMALDEGLVVAMADLLLTSRNIKDLDDVLDLVQQTTGIERQVSLLSSPDRQTGHVPNWEVQSNLERPVSNGEDPDGFLPTPSSLAFKPVAPHGRDPDRPKRAISLAYIKPGNGILSIVVRACSSMRVPKAANAYWDILTTDGQVKPDISNFHTMIQLLHHNRNARRVAQIIQNMHDHVEMSLETTIPLTYQLAMKVCARDHKNPNIMDIATTIVDDMEKHLTSPDVITLELYLSLALNTKDEQQIVAALNRLDKSVEALRDRFGAAQESGHHRKPPSAPEGQLSPRTHIVRFLQAMIGTTNTLVREELVPTSTFEYWDERRAKYDKYLSSAKFGLGESRTSSTQTIQDRPERAVQNQRQDRHRDGEWKLRVNKELAEGQTSRALTRDSAAVRFRSVHPTPFPHSKATRGRGTKASKTEQEPHESVVSKPLSARKGGNEATFSFDQESQRLVNT